MRKIIPPSQPFANNLPRFRHAYFMRWVALVAFVVVVFDGGCRKSTSSDGVPSYLGSDFMLSNAPVQVGHAIKLSDLSESEIHFGIAPKRGPGVTYQDGIILMEHGDKAIRFFASDGMSWTFDANTPQVSDIQVGKVLFATDRCAGKVLGVQRNGNTVTVVLGPVQLNELPLESRWSQQHTNDTLEGQARNRRVELTLD